MNFKFSQILEMFAQIFIYEYFYRCQKDTQFEYHNQHVEVYLIKTLNNTKAKTSYRN